MKALLFALTVTVAPTAAMADLYKEAGRFNSFSGADLEFIRQQEIRGETTAAAEQIRSGLKRDFPAPYQKGLEEKCKVFRTPIYCEMDTIRRIEDERYKDTMDGIFNSVR